jgi:hypothetical protein
MEAGETFSEVAGAGIAVAGGWHASTTTWTDVSPSLGTLRTGPLAICPWAGSIGCQQGKLLDPRRSPGRPVSGTAARGSPPGQYLPGPVD